MIAKNKDSKLTDAKNGMLNKGDHAIDEAQEATSDCKSNTEEWETIARRTGQHAHELLDSSEDSLAHAGQAIKTRIRDNPIQSSLIALGLGLLIGKLFRR